MKVGEKIICIQHMEYYPWQSYWQELLMHVLFFSFFHEGVANKWKPIRSAFLKGDKESAVYCRQTNTRSRNAEVSAHNTGSWVTPSAVVSIYPCYLILGYFHSLIRHINSMPPPTHTHKLNIQNPLESCHSPVKCNL